MVQEQLSAAQHRTLQSIFSHPMSHNIEWGDVHSLFQALGNVVEGHNGSTKVTRNGHTLVVRGSAEIEPATLMKIRHFLRVSGARGCDPVHEGDHLLVVIDHQEARIFRSEERGTVPEKIVPHDPHGFGKHLHNVHDHSKGQHHPVPRSYFEAVAKTLTGASRILLFGAGSGGGSAMNELVDDLHKNHKDLFDLVIGAEVVDESHLTEDQLLAKAREFYASV